jgi:hypothetical protein
MLRSMRTLSVELHTLGTPTDNEEHSIGSAHVRSAAELRIGLRERFR